MKLVNQNIKAFTLVELLVALVIISIVVTTGISVVQLVKQNFNKYQDTQSHFMEMEKNNMQFSHAFLFSEQITYSKESNTIKIDNKENSQFELNNSIVNQFSQDTLFQNIESLKLNFYVSEKEEYLVSKLSFKASFGERIIPFVYEKEYDIKTRLNYPKSEELLLK